MVLKSLVPAIWRAAGKAVVNKKQYEIVFLTVKSH